MNLLVDGVAQNAVSKTGRKQKLLIDGRYEDYEIYRIRLDLLYFNDQNDRIATDISQYNASHPHNLISGVQHDAQYNALIHSFIVKSNEARLKTTQRNIQVYGQMNPGVVLADGRVIDGNRRFACLRNIQESTGAEQYFEASILEHTLGHNAKQIKQLELTIQLGQDRPVEYDPIDRLVGIYNDLICIQEDGKSLLTIQEYLHCLGTNSTEADIKADIERAKLMVEFLESINAPFQFYLAKQMNLNDPLKELYKILKKCRNDEQKDDIKNVVFANLLMQPHGDRIHRLGLPDGQYTQYYYLQQQFITDMDESFSLDARILTRLYEKEQIMLNAIEADCLESVTTVQEDLELIFSGLKL